MNDIAKECGACKYYWNEGQCRRFPPIGFSRGVTIQTSFATWPIVDKFDWCYEFCPVVQPITEKK